MADPIAPAAPPMDSSAVNNIASTTPAPQTQYPGVAGGAMGGVMPAYAQSVPAPPTSSTAGPVGASSAPGKVVGGIKPSSPDNAPAPAMTPEATRALMMGGGMGALMDAMNPPMPGGPSKDKPGHLFRTILSAALVGAAAGAGHGWAGAGEGMKAQVAAQQRQQEAKQQQFKNQMEQKKDAREQDASDQAKIHSNAQIAVWNVEKMKALNEIHGQSYTQHRDFVKTAEPVVVGYKALGNDPLAENVSETEHNQWLKEHPGDTTFDWEPVGVVPYIVKNPDGTDGVDYQTVWNKYDKTKAMAITPDLLKRMKDSGAIDSYPEGSIERSLKPDAKGNNTLPYDAFVSLMTKTQTMENMKYQKQLQEDALTKNQKEFAKLDAEEHEAKLRSQSATGEIELHNMQIKQAKNEMSGGKKLAEAEGDWEAAKLTPDEIYSLQPKVEKDIADARAVLSSKELLEALKDPNQNSAEYKQAVSRANDAFEKLGEAQSHSLLYRKISSDPVVAAVIKRTRDSKASPAELEKALAADPNMTDVQKEAVRLGCSLPTMRSRSLTSPAHKPSATPAPAPKAEPQPTKEEEDNTPEFDANGKPLMTNWQIIGRNWNKMTTPTKRENTVVPPQLP